MKSNTHTLESLRFKPLSSWTMKYPHELQDFNEETRDHLMTIHRSDGLYNHLSFADKNQDFSENYFEVITTPGQLTVQWSCIYGMSS